jgi:hypothetical protein
MSPWALVQAGAYAAIGVDAVLSVVGADYPMRVLDRTGGALVGAPLEVMTSKPAAALRAVDLAAAGLDATALDHALITLNGATWRITSAQPKPSPNGEGDGEYLLLLEGT